MEVIVPAVTFGYVWLIGYVYYFCLIGYVGYTGCVHYGGAAPPVRSG